MSIPTNITIDLYRAEIEALRYRLEGHDGVSCLVCGCTQNDPCEEGCGWADIPAWAEEGPLADLLLGESLCTACEEKVTAAEDRVAVVLQLRKAVTGGSS